jgi:hypothetical protein
MSIGIHFVPEAKLLSHLLLWVVNLWLKKNVSLLLLLLLFSGCREIWYYDILLPIEEKEKLEIFAEACRKRYPR